MNKSQRMIIGFLVVFIPFACLFTLDARKFNNNNDLIAITDKLTENQKILADNQKKIMERVFRNDPVIPEPVRNDAPVVKPIVVKKNLAKTKKDHHIAVVNTGKRMKYIRLDIFCLAKNIYHEASVESRLGQYAVAQVTLNRVRSNQYPNTVCDVVMDPWQFSWANKKSIRWTHPRGPLWENSKKIAENVILRGKRVMGLENALFYHADYVRPRWRKVDAKIAKIDRHIFYTSAR